MYLLCNTKKEKEAGIMLDKSIPLIKFCMRRDTGKAIPEYPLPEGYRFSLYKPGDEKDWARIETSVLEFDQEADALSYFQKAFLSYGDEAQRRCLFVETNTGQKIATASAWWAYTGQRRDPIVHWVAVSPNFQGKGIGKAITARVVKLLMEIEGDRDYYLSTQSWSHKAVVIYEWAGFKITDEKNIIGHANDSFTEAVAIMDTCR